VRYSKYTTIRSMLKYMMKKYTSLTIIAILASVLLLSMSLILPTQVARAQPHTKDQKKDGATGDTKTGQEVNQNSKCSKGAHCIQTSTNILCTHSVCIFGSITPFIYPAPH
jgi:hypothetical protein